MRFDTIDDWVTYLFGFQIYNFVPIFNNLDGVIQVHACFAGIADLTKYQVQYH